MKPIYLLHIKLLPSMLQTT